MANVNHNPQLADLDALYVWAGVRGPQWGSWKAFGEGKTTRTLFPEGDWQSAIAAAKADADRAGLSTVYVVRNA